MINIEPGGTLTNNGNLINHGNLINNGTIKNKGTLSGTNPTGTGSLQTPPIITGHPESQTVTVGQSVTFTVAAIGNPAPTAYQWQVKTVSGNWENIVDATSESYTINPVNFAMNGNRYRCIVTNAVGDTTAEASLTVSKLSQTPPARPELDTKTHDTVTLKVIPANTNGAAVQYSKDGGSTWQDSNKFTGLTANTNYSFAARYKEIGNYKESDKSDVTAITTDNAPSGGGSSSSANQAQITKLSPLKADAKSSVVITKDVILKAIAKAKAEAKDGQAIAVNIAVEAGNTPNALKITLQAEALTELVSSGIHNFVLDTDTLADLGFKTETLKELKAKTTGDVILNMTKVTVTSQEAKAAIGSRPAYDISIIGSKGGKETKIENLNGKTVNISIPYTTTKNEQSNKLCAVYVDEQGKVQWLTKSSYDKEKKAIVFDTNHFSVYGVGYKENIYEFKDIENH